MKQLPLDLPTHSGPSLDNFVPGSNLDCLLYLQEGVASLERGHFSSVYLWGKAGSGKTHLLKAVADAVEQRNGASVWLSPDMAFNVDALSYADVVLLDNCDLYDEVYQAHAFRVFIDAQTYGFWIVAAGKVPPVDLEVREDLRTRLGWGSIFALKALSEEELQAALWHAFHSRGLTLTSAVQDYLLHHFSRDISSLMRLLNLLDRYALALKRAVTVPLIKRMLEDVDYEKEVPYHEYRLTKDLF